MSTELSSLVIAGAIGFASAIFAEPLRRWIFSPKLILSFEDSLDYRTRTPETATFRDPEISAVPIHSNHEAEYVRIRVINDARPMAKECRAYLVGIEKKQTNGAFEPTIYCDSIPLAWSCREEKAYESVDIPNGVAQFIDVVSVRSISDNYRLEIKPLPHRYVGFLHDKGTFRLTVQVSGENVKPVFIRVQFTWNGKWDDYHVQPDDSHT
ncbi:hypothetical protein MIZ01_1545 [Sideroxyarcus emersonii]|uniref:Uncharacterized protein n=1 Tax=Sideroxyarcus emersonii TaxID=2764705 RepID=A0AAN1XAV0_9PROT|nr:hypothetical protein [Sideroxyarcus emersonii]BCK87752.1 hypothetical protein MIZ01_1545 [Sideroxyarcus emersonii]